MKKDVYDSQRLKPSSTLSCSECDPVTVKVYFKWASPLQIFVWGSFPHVRVKEI